ncbi:hypothetical protein AB4K20DRAFT_1872168 [Rhizopus microsporus]
MLAYILEEYELLEQHTHFAANQLIHIYVVELDGYGSIYSFFSKVMSQKFITSCWNESVYLYPQYQRKLVMRSLSHTSLCKTVLSTTEDPDARSFKAAKRCLLLQNLEIRQRCRNSKLPSIDLSRFYALVAYF